MPKSHTSHPYPLHITWTRFGIFLSGSSPGRGPEGFATRVREGPVAGTVMRGPVLARQAPKNVQIAYITSLAPTYHLDEVWHFSVGQQSRARAGRVRHKGA